MLMLKQHRTPNGVLFNLRTSSLMFFRSRTALLQKLSTSLGVKHPFSTMYAPWSNGTVESVRKEVLRVMHAANSKTRTPEADWPATVQVIQRIINNSPSRRIRGRAPITVLTRMASGNPLSVALSTSMSRNVRSIDQARLQQRVNVVVLLETFDEMHKDVIHLSLRRGSRPPSVTMRKL